MAVPTNKVSGDVLLASEWNALAITANAGESGALAAQTKATEALTKATAIVPKPAQGWTATDVAPALAGLRFAFFWTGTVYNSKPDGTGVTATAGNRIAGTLRDFTGSADPKTLGLTVDGDTWDTA